MHTSQVERVVAIANAQKTGGLLEGLGAQARDIKQLPAILEGPVGIAPAHDAGRDRSRKSGHARQQGCRSGVQIDADRVHAVFDHRVEHPGQLALVDIMLVLTDTDAFRIDLHQLGQRILQAARDRDGAAQSDIHIGQLF